MLWFYFPWMYQDKKQCSLFPIDHLLGSEVDNGWDIKKHAKGDVFPPIIKHLWPLLLGIYNRKVTEKDKVPVPHLHTLLFMHFPQTIVNPLAVGDEYTYRWYIKTAITRTPSKAKNQLEWIVKLAPKNQWAIHVLDHRVSFLSMLEADEGWTYTHIQHKYTGSMHTHSLQV